MQIYWGAVPYVVIQIIMVAMIIFFPAIVSSGLDKKVAVDMDQITQQMEANIQAEDDAEAAADATKAATPGTEDKDTTDEDPMKAMQDAIAKEKK
jgi:GntP family gluconate:H+ symporter